jgi:hypothetical protein
VLLSSIVLLILGVLLAALAHGKVRVWVQLVAHSLGLDRVGMLPPADAG